VQYWNDFLCVIFLQLWDGHIYSCEVCSCCFRSSGGTRYAAASRGKRCTPIAFMAILYTAVLDISWYRYRQISMQMYLWTAHTHPLPLVLYHIIIFAQIGCVQTVHRPETVSRFRCFSLYVCMYFGLFVLNDASVCPVAWLRGQSAVYSEDYKRQLYWYSCIADVDCESQSSWEESVGYIVAAWYPRVIAQCGRPLWRVKEHIT